jgi:hypothetical protein
MWNRDIPVPFDGMDLLQRACVINIHLLRSIPAVMDCSFGTRSEEALHCGYLLFGMTVMETLSFNTQIIGSSGRPVNHYNRPIISEPASGMANMLHRKLIEASAEGGLTNAERLWLLVLTAISYQEECVERFCVEQELAVLLSGSANDMNSILHETLWLTGALDGVALELWNWVSSNASTNLTTQGKEIPVDHPLDEPQDPRGQLHIYSQLS